MAWTYPLPTMCPSMRMRSSRSSTRWWRGRPADPSGPCETTVRQRMAPRRELRRRRCAAWARLGRRVATTGCAGFGTLCMPRGSPSGALSVAAIGLPRRVVAGPARVGLGRTAGVIGGSAGAARAGGSGRSLSRFSPAAIGHRSARSVCLNPKSSNASAWPVDRRRLARCRAPSRSERVPRRTARTACSRSRAVDVLAEGHVAEGFAREWDLESESGRLTRSAMELLAWLTISSMCASSGA